VIRILPYINAVLSFVPTVGSAAKSVVGRSIRAASDPDSG